VTSVPIVTTVTIPATANVRVRRSYLFKDLTSLECSSGSSAYIYLFVIAVMALCVVAYKAVNRKDMIRISALLSINTVLGLLVSFLQCTYHILPKS
jgi:hypothetical protein